MDAHDWAGSSLHVAPRMYCMKTLYQTILQCPASGVADRWTDLLEGGGGGVISPLNDTASKPGVQLQNSGLASVYRECLQARNTIRARRCHCSLFRCTISLLGLSSGFAKSGSGKYTCSPLPPVGRSEVVIVRFEIRRISLAYQFCRQISRSALPESGGSAEEHGGKSTAVEIDALQRPP
jgi:hypothetical protein